MDLWRINKFCQYLVVDVLSDTLVLLHPEPYKDILSSSFSFSSSFKIWCDFKAALQAAKCYIRQSLLEEEVKAFMVINFGECFKST